LAIKGLGRGASDAIVEARRDGGPFKDFFDFCERIDTKLVSKAAVEKLIKAGALDRFGRRNQLMTVLPRAFQAAAARLRDLQQGQLSLFEALEEAGPTAAAPAETLPDVPEWPEQEKLRYEKEALDFYFSSHPLAQHEGVLSRFSQKSIADLKNLPPGQEITVGGMLSSVRFQNTKSARNGNTRYARFNIQDLSGQIECVIWPDDLARQTLEPADDLVCFVRGCIDPKSSKERPLLMLTRLLTIEQAQRELTKLMIVSLRLGEHQPSHIDALARALKRTPGTCPVFLDVRDGNGKWARLKLPDEYRVNPLAVATAELEAVIGPGCIKFSGPVNGSARR
jgi:DNA polymerase-3 subunit alpha